MQEKRQIYIIGIEGAGTSALAQLYVARGFEVSGSDEGDGFYRENLRKGGVLVHESFDSTHIPDDVDFVVYSTAYSDDNVEIIAAKEKGLTLLSYPEAVGDLTREHYTIAVCGTHGKTTTTGMVTHALMGAGRDPQAIVGAAVVGWDGGARAGSGRELVLEADEYQDKLALYHPQAVILTSMDYDHPDFFPTHQSYREVFEKFIVRIPRTGILVANHDDWDVQKVLEGAQCKILTYGEHSDADAVLLDRQYVDGTQRITIKYEGQEHHLSSVMPGKHNAMNAIAAWLMSVAVTGDLEGSRAGIAEYGGVARRFQRHESFHGAVVIDDYAHHPEAIRTTLATVREVYPDKNILAAFHPHSHSRTAALLEEFARALDIADHIIVLDIHRLDRENSEDYPVTAEDLVDAINQGVGEKAQHIPTITELSTWATEHLTDQDIFITLGAGDIYKIHETNKSG